MIDLVDLEKRIDNLLEPENAKTLNNYIKSKQINMENQQLEQEENLQALVQLKGNIVRYKTMTDGTMRLELDLGKINSKIASDLHVLNDKLDITIILSTEDLLEQAKQQF